MRAARPAVVQRRADAVGARGGARARLGGPGAVGGGHALQDVGHARHAAPAADRGARAVERRAGHLRQLPQARVVEGVRHRARRGGAPDRRGGRDAGRARADPRRAGRRRGRASGVGPPGREAARELGLAFLKPAAYRGRLQFAPNRGRNVCFTLPAAGRAMDPDEALQGGGAPVPGRARAGQPRRGGALVVDQPGKAGKLLDAIGAEPVEDVEGTELRALPEPEAAEARRRWCGCCPRSTSGWWAPPARSSSSCPAGVDRKQIYRPQGWLTPVLLVSGRVAGLWRHERKGKRIEVDHRAAGEAARLGPEGRRGRGREPGRLPGRRALAELGLEPGRGR